MILSCDPPRHAFLIHFGPRRQPKGIRTIRAQYGGAIVEIAMNPRTAPPTLVAIHFVRHGFRLPFVGPSGQVPMGSHFFHSGFGPTEYFFYLEYEPRDYRLWQAFPGIAILVSDPLQPGKRSSQVSSRPVLRGLQVDLSLLQVSIDPGEFVFECGPDFLKDVSVMLFVDFERSE